MLSMRTIHHMCTSLRRWLAIEAAASGGNTATMRVRGKRCGPQKQNQGGTEDGSCPVHYGHLGSLPRPGDSATAIVSKARL